MNYMQQMLQIRLRLHERACKYNELPGPLQTLDTDREDFVLQARHVYFPENVQPCSEVPRNSGSFLKAWFGMCDGILNSL